MRNKPVGELAALLLVLVFATGADGIMDALGPAGFWGVGSLAMALAWWLCGEKQNEHRL